MVLVSPGGATPPEVELEPELVYVTATGGHAYEATVMMPPGWLGTFPESLPLQVVVSAGDAFSVETQAPLTAVVHNGSMGPAVANYDISAFGQAVSWELTWPATQSSQSAIYIDLGVLEYEDGEAVAYAPTGCYTTSAPWNVLNDDTDTWGSGADASADSSSAGIIDGDASTSQYTWSYASSWAYSASDPIGLTYGGDRVYVYGEAGGVLTATKTADGNPTSHTYADGGSSATVRAVSWYWDGDHWTTMASVYLAGAYSDADGYVHGDWAGGVWSSWQDGTYIGGILGRAGAGGDEDFTARASYDIEAVSVSWCSGDGQSADI